MRQVAVAALCCFALSGCIDEYQAKAKVKSVLKDPDSAQWRNVEVIASNLTCGEVNAKNSLGGFTGFTKFAVVGNVIHLANSPAEEVDLHKCCIDMSMYMRFEGTNEYTLERAQASCGAIRASWAGFAH